MARLSLRKLLTGESHILHFAFLNLRESLQCSAVWWPQLCPEKVKIRALEAEVHRCAKFTEPLGLTIMQTPFVTTLLILPLKKNYKINHENHPHRQNFFFFHVSWCLEITNKRRNQASQILYFLVISVRWGHLSVYQKNIYIYIRNWPMLTAVQLMPCNISLMVCCSLMF